MQKDKTLHFWDDFYRNEEAVAKEWIVQPSDALLQSILDQFLMAPPPVYGSSHDQHVDGVSKKCAVIKVLEIGCGNSSLAADLCSFWEERSQHQRLNHTRCRRLHVVATDVSPVCIAQQKELLQRRQTEGNDTTKSAYCYEALLEYQVLNITEPHHDELHGQFDLILDKGCLDTCLFRSKKADAWLETVLHNLHSWLKPAAAAADTAEDGTEAAAAAAAYVIITPRSKLKAVRDYPGFRVTRKILASAEYGNGDLEPRRSSNEDKSAIKNEEPAAAERHYMHVCRRMDAVVAGKDGTGIHDPNKDDDDDACETCGATFAAFCVPRKSRTEAYWMRHWRGHRQHCKLHRDENK